MTLTDQHDPIEEDRDPVEELATEYLDRVRNGENPSVEEYAERYPELADEIWDLFPTIAAMEGIKPTTRDSERSKKFKPIQVRYLGDYRILGEIGRGGMGIVYVAVQQSLGRRVAVKVLPHQMLTEERYLQRFQREAQLAARLHHPNIVPVFGVGQQDDLHFYVMQYVQGVSLDKLLVEISHACSTKADVSDEPQRSDSFFARSAAYALLSGRFVPKSKIAGGDPLAEYAELAEEVSPKGDTAQPPGTDAIVELDRPAAPGATTALFRSPAHDIPFPILGADQQEAPTEAQSTKKPSRKKNQHYWESIARIGMFMADALDYAHQQGTLHRDVKPGNVMLDDQGGVWLTDFGLARGWDQDNLERTADVAGTLLYVAPEQLDGKPDNRSDVYSLGATLYELLTLRPAFSEATSQGQLIQLINEGKFPTPRSIDKDIPKDLETIILKAMAREPYRRYATAGEMHDDLERYVEKKPIQARPFSALERGWLWCRRNPAIAVLSASALSLLVLVAVLATVGYWHKTVTAEKIENALTAEKEQREKAEFSSKLAQKALDKIFDRFAPDRMSVALWSSQNEEEDIEVPVAPVMSEVTAGALAELLIYYEDLADQEAEDVAIRRKVADAQRRVGVIRQQLGQLEEAISSYQKALAIYARLKTEVSDWSVPTQIAVVHNQLGTVYATQQKSTDSRKAHEQALWILSKFDEKTSPPRLRFEVARTHYLLSHHDFGRGRREGGRGGREWERRGRGGRGGQGGQGGPDRGDRGGRGGPGGRPDFGGRDRAPSHRDRAVTILEDLLEDYPKEPEYRLLLALCHREVPRMFRRGWDPRNGMKDTLDAVDKAAAILKELVVEFPDIPEYRHELAKTYSLLDVWHPRFPKELYPQAKERLQAGVDLSVKLVQEHPHVPDYAASQARLYQQLAILLTRTNELEAAIDCYQKALRQQDRLVRRFPKVGSYRFASAMIRQPYAYVRMQREEYTEAQKLLETAINHMKVFVRGQPRMNSARFMISRMYQELGSAYEKAGDMEKAKEAYDKRGEFSPFGRRGPRGPRGE